MSVGTAAHSEEGFASAALWRVVNGVQLLVGALWTVLAVFAATTAALVTARRSAALTYARRVWAPGILKLLGVRLVIENRPSARRCVLLVANHRSSLDIPVIFAAAPFGVYFLIKRELAVLPFVGWFCRGIGMVFVDRRGGDAAHASIDRMAEVLAGGRSMVAFPEGTRSRGEALPFKSGPFVAAIKSERPVLPTGIAGTASVMPPRQLRFRPGKVTVRFGEELPTTGLDLEARRDLARRTQERVEELAATNGGGA